MNTKESAAHGGKRAGAGRPSAGKKMKSLRLALDVVAILEKQADQTAFVEAAVRAYAAPSA